MENGRGVLCASKNALGPRVSRVFLSDEKDALFLFSSLFLSEIFRFFSEIGASEPF